MKRFFLYVKFYFELKEKELRAEAFDAAKKYYSIRPLRTESHPYPHPVEYTQRREAFQAYQRNHISARRHEYAKNKLTLLNKKES